MRPLAKLTITRERLYRLAAEKLFSISRNSDVKRLFITSRYRKSCGDGGDGGGGVDMDDFVFPDGVSHETSGRTF